MDPDRLGTLLAAGRRLVGEPDLDRVLEGLLEVAREMTGARYAALGVLDAERRELERFVTAGVDAETRRAIGELPRGHGVLGVLIRDPRPLRLDEVGLHPESFGFPPGHPEMHTFLGVPIRVDGAVFGNLYLTEKASGAPFDDADEEFALELAEWAGVAVGNARQLSGARTERDAFARALRIVETTAAIAHGLAGETTPERVLELIVKRGRALVAARGMVISVPEGADLVMVAAAGDMDRALLGEQVPVEASIGGLAFRTGRPTRMSGVGVLARRSPLASRMGVQTALAVPLRFRGRTLGVLAAYDRLEDGPDFTEEDERLMEAFAASAAAALATAQDVSAETLRRSVQAAERERTHWARELHDQTLQDLAALKVLLTGARQAPERATVDRALDGALEQLGVGIAALRGLITDLRPAVLDELGLEPALRALADRVGLVGDVDVRLSFDSGTERPEPALEGIAYRVVQEALTNIVKHAGAAAARVDVTEDDGGIRLYVHDDGEGFHPGEETEGFGLLGMRERVALVDGVLHVDSRPGAGTTVTAELPARPGSLSAGPSAGASAGRGSRG